MTRTGKRKRLRVWIHRASSGASPPAVTMAYTCGWKCSSRVQVQHHRDAELGAEAPRIVREREQRRRRAREKHVEDPLAIELRDRAKLGGEREDDVEVVHGGAFVDPARLRERLALWQCRLRHELYEGS